MNGIKKYFPDLSSNQLKQFEELRELYQYWNERINVISRKDIDHLYEKHVLHSLAIAKVIQFEVGTTILDVGTGGGFPGIPLAILFPNAEFHLVDSIGKKIKVVEEVAGDIKLKNLEASHCRVQQINESFDFVVSRAVTNLPDFLNWTKNKVSRKSFNQLKNGTIYLKGGEFEDELSLIRKNYKVYSISDFFEEEFFETKKVVHIYS
jgi:16S rRNA (guanine527-N7)-methyltransferase